MSDLSDDEVIEKPKRAMSDKQKEALAKGRELARLNREKAKGAEVAETKAPIENEVVEEIKPKKTKKAKKEITVEIPAPEPVKEVKKVKKEKKVVPEPVSEPVVEAPVKKSRKPKIETPVIPPEPEQKPKQTRKPRTKKQDTEPSAQPLQAWQSPQGVRPSILFV